MDGSQVKNLNSINSSISYDVLEASSTPGYVEIAWAIKHSQKGYLPAGGYLPTTTWRLTNAKLFTDFRTAEDYLLYNKQAYSRVATEGFEIVKITLTESSN